MSLLAGQYRPDLSTATFGNKSKWDALQPEKWSIAGEAEGVSTRFNRMFGMAGSSLYAAQSTLMRPVDWLFGTNYEEQSIALALQTADYWNEEARRTQNKTVAGQVLGGFADLAGGVLSGGPVGLVSNTYYGETLRGLSEGIDLQTSQRVGLTRATTMAAGFMVPFSAPLMRGTASAWGAAAQRLGYGVTSNMAVGAASRFAESEALAAGGYADRAAQVRWNDGAAMTVDLVLGLAFGGAAAYMKRAEINRAMPEMARPVDAPVSVADDATMAPRETMQQSEGVTIRRTELTPEQAIAERRAEIQSRADQQIRRSDLRTMGDNVAALRTQIAGVVDSVKTPAMVKAEAELIKAENPRMPARKALQEADKRVQARVDAENAAKATQRAELQARHDGLLSAMDRNTAAREAKNELASFDAKIASAKTTEARLLAAGLNVFEAGRIMEAAKAEEAAALSAVAGLVEPIHIDAALARNLDMFADDTAYGRPKTQQALQAHRTQIAEVVSALRSGRDINVVVDPSHFDVDPRLQRQMADSTHAAAREIGRDSFTPDLPDAGHRAPVDLPDTLPDDIAHETMLNQAHDATLAALPDDMRLTIEGQEMTVAQFREQQAAALAAVDDEVDTVASIFSCLLGGR